MKARPARVEGVGLGPITGYAFQVRPQTSNQLPKRFSFWAPHAHLIRDACKSIRTTVSPYRRQQALQIPMPMQVLLVQGACVKSVPEASNVLKCEVSRV